MSSMKTSISFEPGKDYSFESRLQNTQTKKATKLMPYLSIRTPKEEVTALGGSMEYKSGSLILVDITLDRLLDKTVKVFSKFYTIYLSQNLNEYKLSLNYIKHISSLIFSQSFKIVCLVQYENPRYRTNNY